MITKPAREQIEKLITKDNVSFYLSLYRNMKNISIAGDIQYVSADIRRIQNGVKKTLSNLKKHGYLSSQGEERAIAAFKSVLNVLKDDIEDSPAWAKSYSGSLLHYSLNLRKPYSDAPLSVLIWCLYTDLRVSGHKPSPTLIADFLDGEKIEYNGITPTAQQVSDLYGAVANQGIDAILYAYYMAAPGNTLFPEEGRGTYAGCLSDMICNLTESSLD